MASQHAGLLENIRRVKSDLVHATAYPSALKQTADIASLPLSLVHKMGWHGDTAPKYPDFCEGLLHKDSASTTQTLNQTPL